MPPRPPFTSLASHYPFLNLEFIDVDDLANCKWLLWTFVFVLRRLVCFVFRLIPHGVFEIVEFPEDVIDLMKSLSEE